MHSAHLHTLAPQMEVANSVVWMFLVNLHFLTLFYNPRPAALLRHGHRTARNHEERWRPLRCPPSRGALAAMGKAPLPLVVLACFFISAAHAVMENQHEVDMAAGHHQQQ